MIKKILNFGIINALSQGLYRASILLVFTLSSTKDIEEFALNSTIIMLLTTFQSLGTAGLTLAANTFIPKFKKYESLYTKAIINISLFTASIAGIISFFSIDYLLKTILPESIIISKDVSFTYLSGIIFILCLGAVYKGFFFAKERYYSLAFTSLFSAFTLIISYFIFHQGLLYSYLISIALEFITIQAFFIQFTDLKSVIRQKAYKKTYQELISFIIPASLSGLMLTPVNIVILYILGLLNSPNLISVFNYGMQLRNLIIFLPSVLGSVFLKLLSDGGESSKKLIFMGGINIMTSSIISTIIIVAKLFNFQYLKLISMLDILILCASCILFSLNSVIGNKIVSLLKTQVGLIFNFIWALIFIFTTYFSYKLNIASPFLGLLVSYIVLTIIQTKYILRQL